jgi:hypothetical protein
LANRMREEDIDFEQCSNAFLRCRVRKRLQELPDTLTAEDLSSCGRKWSARFTQLFSEQERRLDRFNFTVRSRWPNPEWTRFLLRLRQANPQLLYVLLGL